MIILNILLYPFIFFKMFYSHVSLHKFSVCVRLNILSVNNWYVERD